MSRSVNRRTFLRKTLTASTAACTLPYFYQKRAWAKDFTNDPTDSDSVTLGFNIPQTGPYMDEGLDELRAFKLAVKHLNGEGDGGLLESMKPLHLTGNGILGKYVDFVVGDTQTNPIAAEQSAQKLIKDSGAIMISGGSASDVALAVQNVCHKAGVIFMAGLTHSNDVTGKYKSRYGFRHFFNAHMSGMALGPVLQEELGTQRRAYHLTADYNWGWSQEESIRNTTEALGWETASSHLTSVGTEDFTPYFNDILKSGADVLVLNHYGHDMIHSLTQAVQAGFREKEANGKVFEIVVPLFSRLMAQGAGDHIKGILGTTNWNWALQDEGTLNFVRSFAQEYGFPPSQAAHTCYCQTLLYANTCEMAGTFYPPEVIKALEGLEFDGMGNGPTIYRAEDHQCMKNILVVRGNQHPSSTFDLLDIVKEVPRDVVTYDPKIFGGELDTYDVS